MCITELGKFKMYVGRTLQPSKDDIYIIVYNQELLWHVSIDIGHNLGMMTPLLFVTLFSLYETIFFYFKEIILKH